MWGQWLEVRIYYFYKWSLETILKKSLSLAGVQLHLFVISMGLWYIVACLEGLLKSCHGCIRSLNIIYKLQNSNSYSSTVNVYLALFTELTYTKTENIKLNDHIASWCTSVI